MKIEQISSESVQVWNADESKVKLFAEQMKRGDKFPPVVVFDDNSTYYLSNGFARVQAARLAGLKEIDAIVHTGTKLDALWLALGTQRETYARSEKISAVRLALRMCTGKSVKDIAEHMDYFRTFVYRIRQDMVTADVDVAVGVRNISKSDEKNVTVKRRGTYENWCELKKLARTIDGLVNQMDELVICLTNRIEARQMCNDLSQKLKITAQRLGDNAHV